MGLYEVDQRVTALQSQVDALKTIIQLDARVTADGTELVPISLPDGSEYKMLAETFFKSRGKAEADDYELVAADKNSILNMTGNSKTLTIPDSLSWQNFSYCYLIQSGTDLTVASGGSVTVSSPQTLGTVQYSIYIIIKTAADAFTVVQIGTAGGGGDTTNNFYSSIDAPQLFNPDASAVSGGSDDYTLSSTNSVAFVSINGQVLDDSEYSLASSTLTVTPDNGFYDTSDEVLVFQHTYAFTAGAFKTTLSQKSATYTITTSDHILEATANTFTFTLPTAVGIAGQEFVIKNSGAGVVTVDGNGSETIDGNLTISISQNQSLTVVSNGSNYIII